MANPNPEPRFGRRSDRGAVEGRVLPYQSGVLPEDFPDRLHRLKEASGLTWNALPAPSAWTAQVCRWRRKGVEPCGGAMLSLFRFAARMPGGLETLMGEGFRMNLWETES